MAKGGFRRFISRMAGGSGLGIGPGTWDIGDHWRPGQAPTRAMREVRVVYSCVKAISSAIASTPLIMYRKIGGDDFEPATDHPLYRLLKVSPDGDLTAAQWMEHMVRSLLLYGNGFARIRRDGAGEVMALEPLDPRKIICRINPNGVRIYETRDWLNQNPENVHQDHIFHVAGPGWNGFRGLSPIQEAARSVEYAAAARGYGYQFLENSAIPAVVVSGVPGQLSDPDWEKMRERWGQLYSKANRFKTAFLPKGQEVNTIGVDPQDAQLIEVLKWTGEDICGIFQVPPPIVGILDHATYSNVEHLFLQFIVHTLMPWFVRMEQAVNLQLMTPREHATYYAKYRVQALQRGDFNNRMQGYAVGRQWGIFSINDIRRLEDMRPVKDGDEYLKPMNMLPLNAPGQSAAGAPSRARADDVQRFVAPAPVLYRNTAAERAQARRQAAQALAKDFLDAFRSLATAHGQAISRILSEAIARELPPDDIVTRLSEWQTTDAALDTGQIIGAYNDMLEAMTRLAQDEVDYPQDPSDEATEAVRETTDQVAIGAARRLAGREAGQVIGHVMAGDMEAAQAAPEAWLEDTGLAASAGRDERTRAENALTRALWLAAGVRYMTWRTVGESCDICKEMDGARTRVSGYFAHPGDEVATLSVSRRVATPPIHAGCDCMILPE